VKLARTIDWPFLEEKLGAVYTDKPGQPPLPTRLMAGLAILKHTYDLSDEALCDRWVENPYFQYFCGEEFFQHALVWIAALAVNRPGITDRRGAGFPRSYWQLGTSTFRPYSPSQATGTLDISGVRFWSNRRGDARFRRKLRRNPLLRGDGCKLAFTRTAVACNSPISPTKLRCRAGKWQCNQMFHLDFARRFNRKTLA